MATAPPSSIAKDLPAHLTRKEPSPTTQQPPSLPPLSPAKSFSSPYGRPAQLWIAARNKEAGQDAVGGIKKAVGGAEEEVDVRFVQLDLTSFASVESAAKEVVGGAERLDVLMLSAGIMGGHPGVTEEGYEKTFGTNHVGHALLLKLLTPLLLKTAAEGSKPRVISLSSTGHRSALPEGGIAFDTLKSPQLDISGVSKYTQSKLANVVYARQVAKHYPQLISVAIHPGEIATQLFNKGADGGGKEIEYMAKEIAPKVCVSVEEGAKNGLWAATAEEVQTGRYYEPVGVLGNGSELSKEETLGSRLWEWTQSELEGH
ncbi:hypothetical protein N0V83_009105 [Neocucurbitaria cava]|uniref:NAD(P)-binding protein n=1 Tax=Neocucurbitaria cava TaxID=798079 RepID=A0A9W8Y3C1_9PLEO|nr:hypothetical protein N0V83_009105 [Neocucurbitaria cava]